MSIVFRVLEFVQSQFLYYCPWGILWCVNKWSPVSVVYARETIIAGDVEFADLEFSSCTHDYNYFQRNVK